MGPVLLVMVTWKFMPPLVGWVVTANTKLLYSSWPGVTGHWMVCAAAEKIKVRPASNERMSRFIMFLPWLGVKLPPGSEIR